MADYRYILFPLPMLQEIFKKPKNGFDHIFDVGVYKVSQNVQTKNDSALKQVLYCFYRGGLTWQLETKLDNLAFAGTFKPDKDYQGFYDDTFNPEEELISLSKYMKEKPDFQKEVIEFYRLRQVKNILKITFDIGTTISVYKQYHAKYDGFKNTPLVSVKTDLMFDYLNEKTDFQKALFVMYAGIKSLIGNKEFVATTREMIICRMFGAKNKAALATILKDKKVKAAYTIFSKRYQFEKLLNYLLAKKFLSAKISMNRRTYLSCKLDYQQLTQQIEEYLMKKSLIYTINEHKTNELEAKKLIKQHLYK